MLNLCEHKSFNVLPKEYERYIMLGMDFSNEFIRNKLENEKLKNERDRNNEEIEKMKKEMDKIKSEHEELKKVYFEKKEECKKLKKELAESKEEYNKLKKENPINITINNYNCPNIKYITSNHYIRCMEDEKTAYLEMFKAIYQNPSHPENHSVYKTNTKNKLIRYYENGKWRVGNQDTIIPRLLDVIYDGLSKESTDDRFNELALLLDTDKKFREKVQNDILIETYNIPDTVEVGAEQNVSNG